MRVADGQAEEVGAKSRLRTITLGNPVFHDSEHERHRARSSQATERPTAAPKLNHTTMLAIETNASKPAKKCPCSSHPIS